MNGPFIELKGGGTYRNLTSEVTCYPEGKVSRSIQLRTDDSGDRLTIVQYFFGGKSITLNPTEAAWLRDQLNAMSRSEARDRGCLPAGAGRLREDRPEHGEARGVAAAILR